MFSFVSLHFLFLIFFIFFFNYLMCVWVEEKKFVNNDVEQGGHGEEKKINR